ncbi:MAG: cation:proton antiporter [Colwellia sp.]
MNFIWILFAFLCGLASKSINMPPSIGYLIAGFLLSYLGYEADDSLTTLSNLGITLMLFMIGLKLNIKNLFKAEAWVASSLHTIIWIILSVFSIKVFAFLSFESFSQLDTQTSLLIAFALSFSSTVCVIKLLEENGEMRTRHAKIAVSILVIQDIVAVAYLVAATGKIPSVLAFALIGLFFIRPLFNTLMSHAGHGELLPLMGFFIAFGSYELFELVNIKGDLGALIVGMMLANSSKASEINKSLMSFKDIFLIGFFLSIGFSATPTLEMLGISILLLTLLPLKFGLFFGLFSLLKLRSRTAFLSALSLSNFSEFGLIVAALSVNYGWLNNEWLVILALTVSLSFVLTNILYRYSHNFFASKRKYLSKFERSERLEEDLFVQPCQAPVMIIGMGRVGMGAYKAICEHSNKKVWGLDADREKISWLNSQNIETYYGDAEDAYFWENIDLSQLELILLALPNVQDSISINEQISRINYQGKIAAIARFDDERQLLTDIGIDKVFNFYNEAGVGFADESIKLIEDSNTAS